MVETLVVTKRLNKLREYVGLLKTLRQQPKERFASDPFVYGSAERYLQLAIQALLDIANHILSDKKLKEPQEYRDVIKILGDNGLLPRELVQRLLPLVGLRNMLVHDYMEIDRERLYEALRKELGDFEALPAVAGFAPNISRLAVHSAAPDAGALKTTVD